MTTEVVSSSSSSSSSESRKRAGSTDSDDSFASKKSRSISLLGAEDIELEPYVRRRRGSNEKIKNRLMKLDPEEQDRHRQCINSRERKRMHNLNSALDRLRNVLPQSKSPKSRKLSKINTIDSASDWIVHLIQENNTFRKQLSDLGGVPLPPLSMPIALPSPPSTSPPDSKKKSTAPPKATRMAVAPPPLDPAPHQMSTVAASLFSNFPHLLPSILHHHAAVAAAAVGTFIPPVQQPSSRSGPSPSNTPLGMALPPSQLSSFCPKKCGNNGVCLCINCLLSKKNGTVS